MLSVRVIVLVTIDSVAMVHDVLERKLTPSGDLPKEVVEYILAHTEYIMQIEFV